MSGALDGLASSGRRRHYLADEPTPYPAHRFAPPSTDGVGVMAGDLPTLAADGAAVAAALDADHPAHGAARALFTGAWPVAVVDLELNAIAGHSAEALATLPALRLLSARRPIQPQQLGTAPLALAYGLAVLRQYAIAELVTPRPERYAEIDLAGLQLRSLRPTAPLPYGRHAIDEADLAAVARVLGSDWLTGGPEVERFEAAFARYVDAPHAVALASGTAALHAALAALGIGPGDEVIVPPMTFVATANAVLYVGARPVFADVSPDTLTLDPAAAAAAITTRTRAIIAVDYAGHPADYPALQRLAERHGLALVGDSCHALGARQQGRPLGTQAAIHLFSLHPVKHITAGEGGVATSRDPALAEAMRRFRNHCLSSDFRSRERSGQWGYDVPALGHNYRLSDLQCALARSQLTKAGRWLAQRSTLAERYSAALAELPAITPLGLRRGCDHAWHLFVVRSPERDRLLASLRQAGILANFHYRPVHTLHLYRERYGPLSLPVAEQAAAEVLSLPIFGTMGVAEQERVVSQLRSFSAG